MCAPIISFTFDREYKMDASITIDNFKGFDFIRNFFPLPSNSAAETPFLETIQSRRSVHAFKNRPVPRKILEKIVHAIAFAPPGFPPLRSELAVVEDRNVIRRALPEMVKVYDGLIRAMGNPLTRHFIRRAIGAAEFNQLEKHVAPLMNCRLPKLKRGIADAITRNAPAMIIFHAPQAAETCERDTQIALTFGLLIAHEFGLGATAADLIPPAIEHSISLRRLFSIPEKNVIVASMILGYPKAPYRSVIKVDFGRTACP